MKTQVSNKQPKQAPRVIELGNSYAQLRDTERHLLRERRIAPRQCHYLSNDEIAEILSSVM